MVRCLDQKRVSECPGQWFFSAKVNHWFHGQWAKSWYSKQVHAKNCLFSDTVDINQSCVKPYDACCLFDNAWGCASQQTMSKRCKYQRKVQKCCKTKVWGQKQKGPKGSWFHGSYTFWNLLGALHVWIETSPSLRKPSAWTSNEFTCWQTVVRNIISIYRIKLSIHKFKKQLRVVRVDSLGV